MYKYNPVLWAVVGGGRPQECNYGRAEKLKARGGGEGGNSLDEADMSGFF